MLCLSDRGHTTKGPVTMIVVVIIIFELEIVDVVVVVSLEVAA